MKAEEYLKAKGRMTTNCHTSFCIYCPFAVNNNGYKLDCRDFEFKHIEEAVKIIEKWAEENPPETYLGVLFRKFPHAKIYDGGLPDFCVNSLFGDVQECEDYDENCIKCWNSEYVKREVTPSKH